ncbi:hypothetical protein V5O48_011093 [Marasmius crinis-equi]|uniref:Uncharacterized protein n=1 Tax=Marasmius crinis-equi TaxID=585013 RepID=A0ABR3F6J7_9AGAR
MSSQPFRRAWMFAANTMWVTLYYRAITPIFIARVFSAEDYAPGGFLNSQTSDTQVFGFETSSGAPVFRDDRSEGDDDYQDEDVSQLINDDDLIEESQIPGYDDDEYHDSQSVDTNQPLDQRQVDGSKLETTSPDNDYLSRSPDQEQPIENVVSSTPSTPAVKSELEEPTQLARPAKRSTPHDGFEPVTEPDHKKVSVTEPSSSHSRASKTRKIVDNVLAAKYKDRNLILELLEEAEREAERKPNWSVNDLIINEEHDRIIRRMCCDLGLPTDRDFQQASVLRKAHLAATLALFRLSCRPLLLEAGVTDDLDLLKDLVANGKVLLAATARLISIEENTRTFSEQR